MTQEQFNDLPDFIKEQIIASGARPDQVEIRRVHANNKDDEKTRLLRALFGADENNESENEDNPEKDTAATDVDDNGISPNDLAKVIIESGITDPKTIESITGMPIEETAGMGADATADDYVVTVTYSVMGHYHVRAASVEDAIKTIDDNVDQLPPLEHPVMLPGTIAVADDPDYTAAINTTKVANVTESNLVSDVAKRLDKKTASADEQ